MQKFSCLAAKVFYCTTAGTAIVWSLDLSHEILDAETTDTIPITREENRPELIANGFPRVTDGLPP